MIGVQSNFAIFCVDSLDVEIEQLAKHINHTQNVVNEYVKKTNIQESELKSLIKQPEYYSSNSMNMSMEEKVKDIEILFKTFVTQCNYNTN